jgi:plasmid stabilization system protein ParE
VEIASWYRRERPAYEERFFQRFRATLERVEASPASLPLALEREGVRKARILRTNYAIAFVEATGGAIEVIAVVHGARRPGWWTKRFRTGV